jgi:small multidrug resistance family-3 protein
MEMARAAALLLTAGLLEIGGGWMMWSWLRHGRGALWGVAGALALMLYGMVPTFQQTHFGRVYAAYGGVFIALSLLWGWKVDGMRPDRFDVAGAVLCLAGAAVILYAPRAS